MSKRKYRRYTDEERSTAVLFLESEGYFRGDKGALTRVAARLNIPHQNLSRWAREKQNPPPPEMVQEKRKPLIALIMDEVYAALGDGLDDARDSASYKDRITAGAILVDKAQLLQGGATERQDVNVNINGHREDIQRRLDRIASTRQEGRIPSKSNGNGNGDSGA